MGDMDLFESAGTDDVGVPLDSRAPLAVRMRPRTLDEVVGQDHLLVPGSPLRRLVDPPRDRDRGAGVASVILWGPRVPARRPWPTSWHGGASAASSSCPR